MECHREEQFVRVEGEMKNLKMNVKFKRIDSGGCLDGLFLIEVIGNFSTQI